MFVINEINKDVVNLDHVLRFFIENNTIVFKTISKEHITFMFSTKEDAESTYKGIIEALKNELVWVTLVNTL